MSITVILCILIGLVSYQAFNSPEMLYKLKHYPYEEVREKSYYRFVTSIFVHGSWTHLLVNLFVFYGFGEAVEAFFTNDAVFGPTMGRINFILLFLLSGIFADLPTYLKHKDNQMFSAVGASGAVSGILLAFVIFQPWAPLRFLLFPFFDIPAIVMVAGFLAYSSWASSGDRSSRIDHSAHFYGAVFGFVFTIALKPDLFNYFLANLGL